MNDKQRRRIDEIITSLFWLKFRVGTLQDQELTHEVTQHRKPYAGESSDQEYRGKPGSHGCDAAVV